VLIVEDEAIVAFDNETLLLDAGYEIAGTVDNAADAIALMAQGGIDLVLTDIAINGNGDGRDVARAAHRHGIAVLFAAGTCPVGGEEFAIGCLAKPYSALMLTSAIEAVDQIIDGQTPRRVPEALSLYGTR
jgi:DNA-binding NarL/FixJ family response regulator